MFHVCMFSVKLIRTMFCREKVDKRVSEISAERQKVSGGRADGRASAGQKRNILAAEQSRLAKYIKVCTCTHTHTHARTHARTRAHTHTHTHTRARTHTHTHARTHTHTHTHTRTHAHARTHARTHTRTHTQRREGGENFPACLCL